MEANPLVEVKTEESKYPAIALHGCMGSGKSSTGNSLTDFPHFEPSASTESCTQEPKLVTTHWFGDLDLAKANFIDTPGLGSGPGKDDDIVVDLVIYLQKLGKIDIFAFVFNGENSRFWNC